MVRLAITSGLLYILRTMIYILTNISYDFFCHHCFIKLAAMTRTIGCDGQHNRLQRAMKPIALLVTFPQKVS